MSYRQSMTMHEITQVRGRNPKGKQVMLDKSQPVQMSLFQTFLGDGDKYSNTLELYDAIPKYYPSRQVYRLREHHKYLPILKRQFQHRNRLTGQAETYHVTIKPARLEDEHGQEREYYPTEREELVEEALRKLATDKLNGIYLSDQAGVQFTLYELRKELAARGHSIHLSSLIEALKIGSEATVEVKRDDGLTVLTSSIFPVLMIANREEWLANPRTTRCYVQFNPLMTHSVNRLTYRQFDYVTFMGYERQLSRWFHKRLSHNFTNADHLNTFDILATTVIRDSGLLHARQFRDNLSTIDTVLEELRAKGTIAGVEKEVRTTGKGGRINEVLYRLRPHYTFVQEMKAANKRQQVINKEAERSGYSQDRTFK